MFHGTQNAAFKSRLL